MQDNIIWLRRTTIIHRGVGCRTISPHGEESRREIGGRIMGCVEEY